MNSILPSASALLVLLFLSRSSASSSRHATTATRALTPEGLWARVGSLIDSQASSPHSSSVFHPRGGDRRHMRSLQTTGDGSSGVTFDQACSVVEQVFEGGGALVNATQAWLNCTCDTSTNTLACYTPQYICPNITDAMMGDDDSMQMDDPVWGNMTVYDQGDTDYSLDVCASVLIEVSFLEDLSGLSGMKICVDYEGVADPSGPYRDGCVSATMASDGMTIDTCKAEFDDGTGTVTACNSCQGCGGEGLGFALDCSNIYPNATTNGCFGIDGGSAQDTTFLFPAAQNAGSGAAGNGTITDNPSNDGTGGDSDGDGDETGNGGANGSQNTSGAAAGSSRLASVALSALGIASAWAVAA